MTTVLYQPQYRVHGTTNWINFGNPVSATSVTITGLAAGTEYDFQVLATDVFGNAASSAVSDTTTPAVPLPGDASGVTANRIADMMERFGVNTFSTSATDFANNTNEWGPIMPADYRSASVIAGINWLTANDNGLLSGSGMTMLVREYHVTGSRSDNQKVWCPAVAAGTGGKFTICVGPVPSAAQGADINTLVSVSSNGTGWLAFTEGSNEPNKQATTETAADCVTLQQNMFTFSRQANGVQCISPSVIDTGSATYITDYFSPSQVTSVVAASDLWNIHLYPKQNPDFGGSVANGQLASAVTYESRGYGAVKPTIVTEFHPTLFSGQSHVGDDTYNAYYTALFFLSCFRLNVQGWFWFSLLEYGAAKSTYPAAVGLFPVTGGVSPTPTASVIRAMYGLTGDKSATKRSFVTSTLNYQISGLPAAVSGFPNSGGQHMLFQNSAGTFFLFIWNSQNAISTSTVQVTVTFPSHAMARVRAFNLTKTPSSATTATKTVTSVSSMTVSLGTDVHLLVIDYNAAASGVPGAPILLTAGAVSSGSTVLTWSPPTSGGTIDAGGYQVQYRPTTSTTWVNGPMVPIITPGVGSFKDSGGNTWTITTGGQLAVGGTVDTTTNSVVLALFANNLVWQTNTSGFWYSKTLPTDTWADASKTTSPLTDPGVTVSGLTDSTPYTFQVFAFNTTGNGPGATVTTAGAAATLTFSDHFDGTTIDWTKWNACFNYDPNGDPYDGSTTSFGVNPNYSGTSDPSLNPLSIGNSILTMSIMPIPTQFQGTLTGNKQYISGIMVTQDKFSQQYGYFEARMKVHSLTGLLSAFWLLPEDGSWPPELDVTEIHGDALTTNITTSHSTTDNNTGNVANPPYQTITDAAVNWHLFGLEWTATKLTWYVDRVAVATGTTPSDISKPFYILLTDYAGSSSTWYPAPPDPSGPWPNTMQIDYVMVWDRKPFGTAGTITSIALTNSQVAVGAPVGTVVGRVTVTMSDGSSFTGTLSLGGTNAASFTISGDTISTAAVLTAGTYAISVTATPTSGSPLTNNFSITASAAATGGPGPAASSNFVTADFTNMTSPSGTPNVVVPPQLFGVATAGMCNNKFAACSNTQFQNLVRALNLPLLRINSSAWSNNPTDLAPFATAASAMLPSTCTLIMGVWTSSQAGYKAISDYWVAHGTRPCTYWEIGNEVADANGNPVSESVYESSYVVGAAGVRQTNSSFLVGGPSYAGFPGTGYLTSFIADNNASTLGFLTYHQYLYCEGQDPTPTSAQLCLAINPNSGNNEYSGYTKSAQAATSGTYAAGVPIIMDEYNNECGASQNDLRAGTCQGAAFLVSCLMGSVSTATQPVWGGIWDLYDDGGAAYNLIDTTFNLLPQYYMMQQLIAHMPGNMVNTSSGSSGSNVQAWATKSGTSFGVAIVNARSSTASGTVALSHWPVNGSGNGTVHVWTYPSGDLVNPVLNTPGNVTQVSVTAGVTATISVPAYSVAMIYP